MRQKIQLLIINPRNAEAVTDDEDTFLDGQPMSRMERIKLLGQMDNNLNLLVTKYIDLARDKSEALFNNTLERKKT